MEIIQQKLIWLIGSLALFFIIRKLQLDKTGIPRSIASRLRLGVTLLLSGSLLGLVSHLFSLNFQLYRIDLNYFVEIGFGYIAGWSFIIWGIIEWANLNFDRKGRPVSITGSTAISEKIARALYMKLSPNLLIDQIAREVIEISECQAITLHQTGPDDILALAYQSGFNTETEKIIAMYDTGGDNIFASVFRTKQAVVTEDMALLHRTESLTTRNGSISSALSVPVTIGETIVAVLTIYRTNRRHYSKGDIELLAFIANALSGSIESSVTEKSYNGGKMLCDLGAVLNDIYDGPESLVQSFLESTKIINRYIQFEKAALYLHGSGEIQTLEWNFPDGLSTRILNGYFPVESYPRLNGKHSLNSQSNIVCNGFIENLSKRPNIKANLEISFGRTIRIDSRVRQIFQILGEQIIKKIESENHKAEKEKMRQWLGALRLFHQKSMVSSNVSEMMQEIAEMVTNLTPASLAKITLADFDKNIFKTAAISQARNFRRVRKFDDKFSMGDAALHLRAINENKILKFNQEDINLRMTKKEYDCMMPIGIKHGIILPISVNNRVIGLLTIGESRNIQRQPLNDMTYFFLSNVMGLISTIFMLHRERLSGQINNEGVKRLTLKLGAAAEIKKTEILPLNIKSRVNGPLAGIMASCEYLKNINPDNPRELNRYLEIIERNANKIHRITSGDIPAVKEMVAKQ